MAKKFNKGIGDLIGTTKNEVLEERKKEKEISFSSDEIVKTSFQMDKAMFLHFKIWAIKNNTSMQEFLETSINKALSKDIKLTEIPKVEKTKNFATKSFHTSNRKLTDLKVMLSMANLAIKDFFIYQIDKKLNE